MEALESFDFSTRSGGKTKYNFDKLFDGGIYRLTRGDDFDEKASVKSVRGYMHTQASKRGKSLRTQAEGDDTFVIQASEKSAKPAKVSRRRRAANKTPESAVV